MGGMASVGDLAAGGTVQDVSAVTGKIIGGVESTPGAYPWMVALVDARSADDFQGQFCAGTLVAPAWVLTAAHCVTDAGGTIRSVADLVAVIGRHDLFSTAGERIPLERIVVHPGFDPLELTNDIALIELDFPSSTAPALMVGQTYDAFAVSPGEIVRALGWGRMTSVPRRFPSALREVDLPVASSLECQQRVNDEAGLFGEVPFVVQDTMLCIVNTPGKDTCEGDSGGPLVVEKEGDRWMVVGITSFGPGCPNPGVFGIYTRVSRYADWISEITCDPVEPVLAPATTVTVAGTMVTASASEEAAVDGYRLYFAPFPEGSPIFHTDLGPSRFVSAVLESGSSYFVAFQTYRGSCSSSFTPSSVTSFTVP